jgi:rhodanese-related sulfurtransferase
MPKKQIRLGAFFIPFILLISAPVSAQGPGTAGTPPTVMDLVAEAKASVKSISPAELKQALDRKEAIVILDVRDPGEYAGGHLPGAVNISRGTLEFKVRDKLPDMEAKIIVYCLFVGRAALAARTLQTLGYRNVALLDAPLQEWLQAGYPLEK